MSNVERYRFKYESTWELRGMHVQQAKALILDCKSWTKWWKGIWSVKVLDETKGMFRVTNGYIIYFLPFVTRLEDKGNQILMHGLEGGELIGNGIFFLENINGNTQVVFKVDIFCTRDLINLIAKYMPNLFKFTHEVSVTWMARGMARQLQTTLLSVKTKTLSQ